MLDQIVALVPEGQHNCVLLRENAGTKPADSNPEGAT
jgi:hypothetical protein